PGAIELEPYGTFVIRGRRDNVIYAVIDSSHHLCYNPFDPNELLYFNIIGGRGNYEGASGSGTAQLFDTVLMSTPEGAPLLVDSQGIITVTLSLH
ncbi:MAG TPA: hypothetical protein VJP40_07655, partial [bacterium]|nr:hypothetical protein [bacterium]